MTTIAFPSPPNPGESNRLHRLLQELRDQDAAHPRPRTVTVWDGAQNRFRAVDPKDTDDFLHAAAVEVDRLVASQRARSAKAAAGEAKQAARGRSARSSKAGWWSRVKRWLPRVAVSKAESQRHIAERYLEAARKAAREGRHIEAQHHARCCVEISRAMVAV